MKIAVVGTGRMGRILAARMASKNEVLLYDADNARAKAVAKELQVTVVSSLKELNTDATVLAIPDGAVEKCIAEMLATGNTWKVFSVATNISREMLSGMTRNGVQCLNAKIIGHAGEMCSGARPVIVIDAGNSELIQMARLIFVDVGTVVVGNTDSVKQINSVATEEALKASLSIERKLKSAGITDPVMIRGALSQVAPGVMRAYADDDLGPFAREIVRTMNDKYA